MEGAYILVGDNYGVPTWHQVSEGTYLQVGDHYGVPFWNHVNGGLMIEDVSMF